MEQEGGGEMVVVFFSSQQGHGYEVMFARDVDAGAGKDSDGIVLSRTRLIAIFFLSTKEETGSG